MQAAEHARNEKTQRTPCLCKTCKNMRIFTDTTTIRSHVLVGGFVKNYMIWTYHARMFHLQLIIHSMKSYKVSSLIECLMLTMILMLMAAMMMVLMDSMVMVSDPGTRDCTRGIFFLG
jgi:hypothetical protein